MTEQEVRAAVNKWSESGFFRQRHFGDRISIGDATELNTYVVSLETEYEERSVSRKKEPYKGSKLDDSGTPPNPTTIPVEMPAEFENKIIEIPVPHTESAEQCGSCSGAGQKKCPHCGGFGRRICGSCSGSGRRMQMQQRPVFQGGKTVYQSQSVSVVCTSCSGGRVPCTCRAGWLTCSSCSGTGKLKVFDMLHVHFRPSVLTEIINTTAVPDDLLRKSKSVTLGSKTASVLNSIEPIAPEVDPKVGAVITKSKQDAARIVRQRLQVGRVPVYQIAFSAPKSVGSKLWIYGEERAVYAPDVRASKGRTGLVIGLVTCVVLLLLFLMSRH